MLCLGTYFCTAVFRRMLPYAEEHDIRLVFLALRDYPGSSPFTPTEIDALRNPETQADAIRARGREISVFLTWFIEKEAIPLMSIVEDGDGVVDRHHHGGLALLGWSSGNATTLSFLAHADTLPAETRTLLGSYLRTFILYGGRFFLIARTISSFIHVHGQIRRWMALDSLSLPASGIYNSTRLQTNTIEHHYSRPSLRPTTLRWTTYSHLISYKHYCSADRCTN